jgi:hypothetical protein
MPITINGSGTVTGISAGGLPDGVITTDDIAAGAVTDAKVNASAAIADSKLSGATCKAWVNFNGTGTVAIRASYNVSSITDNGVGNYTVNFTSALADANYSICAMGNTTSAYIAALNDSAAAPTASAVRVLTTTGSFTAADSPYGFFAIFR